MCIRDSLRADRHLAPGALGDARDELVAVAAVGLLSPFPQPDHLPPEAGGVGLHRAHREEGGVVLLGEASGGLVETHIILAALDQRVRRPAAHDPPYRLRQPGQVLSLIHI